MGIRYLFVVDEEGCDAHKNRKQRVGETAHKAAHIPGRGEREDVVEGRAHPDRCGARNAEPGPHDRGRTERAQAPCQAHESREGS